MPRSIDAAAAADLARAEKIEAQERHLAVEWEKKAIMAVKAGNDDLAKEALRRKLEHEALAVEASASAEDAREQLAELRAAPELRSSSAASPVAVPAIVSRDPAAPRPDELRRRLRAAERAEPLRELRDANLNVALRALKAKIGVDPLASSHDDENDLDDIERGVSLRVRLGRKKDWPN